MHVPGKDAFSMGKSNPGEKKIACLSSTIHSIGSLFLTYARGAWGRPADLVDDRRDWRPGWMPATGQPCRATPRPPGGPGAPGCGCLSGASSRRGMYERSTTPATGRAEADADDAGGRAGHHRPRWGGLGPGDGGGRRRGRRRCRPWRVPRVAKALAMGRAGGHDEVVVSTTSEKGVGGAPSTSTSSNLRACTGRTSE